jgi:DNA-binding NarL/FixJ family response regulator
MAQRRRTVFVVGGHPVIRGVVRLACEGMDGVEVVGEAATADDAAGSAAASDLVVLDLDLPDGQGMRLLRELRPTEGGPLVLVLADRVDGSTVLEALRLGASGFLPKAEGLRRMAEAIRKVLAGERVVPAELDRAAVSELGRFVRRAREGSVVEATLTPREAQILAELADGRTMRQIGRRLGISPRTVETHVAKLYRKLGVRTRVQAVARAASLGLIDLR